MSVLIYQDLVSKYENDQPLDAREASFWLTRLFRYNNLSAETNIINLLMDETKNISKDRREGTPTLLKHGLAAINHPEKFNTFCKEAELNSEQGHEALYMLIMKSDPILFPDYTSNSKDIIASLPENISDPIERKKAEMKLEASCEVACAFLKVAP